MSRPLDDHHPLVREWIAYSAEHLRKAAGDESYEATLRAQNIPESLGGPLGILVEANVAAAFDHMKTGATPGQAIGDAVLSGILFGVRLARKGLV